MRGRISLKSRLVSKAPGIEVKKLGQPVPESNFCDESKSFVSHAAQPKTPARFSFTFSARFSFWVAVVFALVAFCAPAFDPLPAPDARGPVLCPSRPVVAAALK